MKRFLIQISIFILVVLATILIIFISADGRSDAYYKRFTSPKQTSLILGTSRTAQALNPEIFKDILNKDFYNFAFTNAHSPYGPVYLESIKKKLKKNTKDGIFIICVDPWSLSTKKDVIKTGELRENNLSLANTTYLNTDPNLDYMFNSYNGWYMNILIKRFSDEIFLNDYGRLEVNIPMDTASVKKRTEAKIRSYREEFMPIYEFSKLRYLYLIRTIQYLDDHGNVYLVRLPVNKQMKEIEDQYMPEFNDHIIKLIPIISAYFDFSEKCNDYVYTDGNHMHTAAGDEISKEIANMILK